MNNAVVVFSGGQDSTTCLFWALEKFDNVKLISFDYGQRNIGELDCAKKISLDLSLEHKIMDMRILSSLTENAMTRKEISIENGKGGEPPTTFVDGRNMIFLTYAAIYAKKNGAENIVAGVCETDFSGYPDCRDVFIKSLNVTLNLAMDYRFIIHTPLMWLNKEQEWEMADRMGKLEYIKENTLTCYNNVKDGCMECPACRLRNRGYELYLKRKGNGNGKKL